MRCGVWRRRRVSVAIIGSILRNSMRKTEENVAQLSSDDVAIKHGRQNSIILKATSQGRDKLTASLTYFSALNETKEILKVAQEVMVCDQVKFSLDKSDASPTIFRSWAPAIYQEVVLRHPVTRNGSLQTWVLCLCLCLLLGLSRPRSLFCTLHWREESISADLVKFT